MAKIKRVSAYLAKPYDAEIEYLESTGTQWIDTEVKLATTSSARVTLDFYHLGSSSRNIFGSNDSEGFNCYLQTQTTIGFYLCGGYVRQSVPLSVNERHSLDWSVASTGEGSVILDGITYTTSARTLKQSTVNFYLYAQVPLESRTSRLKIYNCQIYVSDVLVRDFISVRFTNELGQSEGAMYDKVSGQLFRNQGTGSFVLGPDKRKHTKVYMVQKKPYDAEIEYLEDVGGQYIDTGKLYSVNTHSARFVLKVYPSFKLTANEAGFIGRSNTLYAPVLGINGRNFYTWSFPSSGWVITSAINGWNDVDVSFTPTQRDAIINDSPYSEVRTSRFDTNSHCLIFTTSDTQTYWAYSKIAYCKIVIDSILVRDFIPVRFTNEQGQTEGAMYDKVSGQLFRNQGTGSFVLGPDKPKQIKQISVNLVSREYSAKDYIRDGLIAMWDGIENAGLGTHDANATVWRDLTGNKYDVNLSSAAKFVYNAMEVTSLQTNVALGTKVIPHNDNGYHYEIVCSYDGTLSNRGVVIFTGGGGDSTIAYSSVVLYAWASYSRKGFVFGNPATLYRANTDYTFTGIHQGSGTHDFSSYDGVVSDVISFSDTIVTRLFRNAVAFGVGDTDNTRLPVGFRVHALRIYQSRLSEANRLANYAIDKARFNLP